MMCGGGLQLASLAIGKADGLLDKCRLRRLLCRQPVIITGGSGVQIESQRAVGHGVERRQHGAIRSPPSLRS